MVIGLVGVMGGGLSRGFIGTAFSTPFNCCFCEYRAALISGIIVCN